MLASKGSASGEAVGTGVLVQCPQYGQVVLTAAHVANAVFAPERCEYSADRPEASNCVPFDLPLRADDGVHNGRVIEWAAPRPPANRAGHPVVDVALLEMVIDGAAVSPATGRILKPEDFEALAIDELKGCKIQCYGFPDRAGQGRYAFGEIQGRGVGGLLHLVAEDDRGHFIEPGFSGAPLFDERGQKVLGMAIAMDADQETRLAFAVPTRLLWRACPQLAQPYRGLKVFEEEDAEFFFGRETFTEELFRKSARHKIFGVTGASGAGKSSAIRAGLLPKLKAEGAIVLVMRPYNDPLKQLAEALSPRLFPATQLGERASRVRAKATELGENPLALRDDAKTVLDDARASRLVIFVDQFEELFTASDVNGDLSAPAGFDFRDLMVATAGLSGRAGAPKLQWLYSLRGDFADRAFRHPAFKDAVGDGNEFLPDMRPEELRDAIRKPAAALDVELEGGIEMQPGLVERISRDAGATVGSLPLMQHVLEKLWEGMRERRLTHRAYEDLGELTGALDRHADAVFMALTAGEQGMVPHLFSRLVNLKEDGQATRRVVRRSELDPALWGLAVQLATEVERTDQDPVESRLLSIRGGVQAQTRDRAGLGQQGVSPTLAEQAADASAGTVEVAHEALLKYWNRLRDWVSERKDFLLWRSNFDRRIAELEEYINREVSVSSEEMPTEFLLRGRHLIEATSWRETRLYDLDAKQIAFIDRSMQAAEREEERLAKERQERADAALRQEKTESELRNAQQILEQYKKAFGLPQLGIADRFSVERAKTPALPRQTGDPPAENWVIAAIGADQSRLTGSGVTIGCIDSGIDADHPAFGGVELIQRDFTGEGNGDKNGHGTATASVILGRTVEGQRVGIATGVERLVVAKVIGATSAAGSDLLLRAILWLHEENVDIIHIGLGFDFISYGDMLLAKGMNPKQMLAVVLKSYYNNADLFGRFVNSLQVSGRPTLIFAPAGNESTDHDRVPVTSPIATAKGIISVGAVARGQHGFEPAAFTNLDPTICAPGSDVPVAKAGGGFGAMSGTTMSCAVAVGAAALWWEYIHSRVAAVNPQEVAARILASATKSGFAPDIVERLLGYGMIKTPRDNTIDVARDDPTTPRKDDGIFAVPVLPIKSV